MTKPTHVPTIVEPVDFVQLAKEQTKSYENFITKTLQKDTYKRIYDLLDKNFDDNLNDFEELIRITEVSKDMGFDDQSGGFIEYLKEHHSAAYQNYLLEGKSDYTSADGKDV